MKHEELFQIVKKLPEDYDPWGKEIRWQDDNKSYPDCSYGCKYAIPLQGDLGMDWIVCTNPESHRVGLLTFEHQGCQKFIKDKQDV